MAGLLKQYGYRLVGKKLDAYISEEVSLFGGVTNDVEMGELLELLSERFEGYARLQEWLKTPPQILKEEVKGGGQSEALSEDTLRPSTFDRYVRYAWFLVERLVPFSHLEQRSLQTGLARGRHGPGKGAIWDALYQEWNRTHPDLLLHEHSVAGFKKKCQRALEIEQVREKLFGEFRGAYETCWDTYERARDVLVARFGVPSYSTPLEKEAAQALGLDLVRGNLEILSRFAEEGWPGPSATEDERRIWADSRLAAYRDSLTLEYLVRNRLFKIVMWTSFGFEEEERRLAAPLRPWFLSEAGRVGDFASMVVRPRLPVPGIHGGREGVPSPAPSRSLTAATRRGRRRAASGRHRHQKAEES